MRDTRIIETTKDSIDILMEMASEHASKDTVNHFRESMAGEIGAVRDAMRDYVAYSATLGTESPTPADFLAYTVNGLLRHLDDMGLIADDD